jgi:hypothetical protein
MLRRYLRAAQRGHAGLHPTHAHPEPNAAARNQHNGAQWTYRGRRRLGGAVVGLQPGAKFSAPRTHAHTDPNRGRKARDCARVGAAC